MAPRTSRSSAAAAAAASEPSSASNSKQELVVTLSLPRQHLKRLLKSHPNGADSATSQPSTPLSRAVTALIDGTQGDSASTAAASAPLSAVASTGAATPLSEPGTPSKGDENGGGGRADGADSGAATPNAGSGQPVAAGSRRKGLSLGGSKRGSMAGSEAPDGSKGKPGPKKKIKADPNEPGSTPDPSAADVPPLPNSLSQGASTQAGAALGGPKLGPKANQGAINSNLRALDRSGKPCKRWEKKPLMIKSFTGVDWPVVAWQTDSKPTGRTEESNGSVTAPGKETESEGRGKENEAT